MEHRTMAQRFHGFVHGCWATVGLSLALHLAWHIRYLYSSVACSAYTPYGTVGRTGTSTVVYAVSVGQLDTFVACMDDDAVACLYS